MTLEEKSVDYILHEVDIFASDASSGASSDESSDTPAQRHPFHRIPTFEHDGFELYETAAITRYADEVSEAENIFYVLAFKERQEADQENFEQKKEELSNQLTREKASTLLTAWVEYLKDGAEITINDSLL